VDYLAPVPIHGTIVVRACVEEAKGCKSIVAMTLHGDDKACAKRKMVAVQIPDDFLDS